MNPPPPLVSIRCLVYNHEPFLRQCLDGFAMQRTDFPFEAIVHDDASTDGSAAIIREYAEKYPDIIKPIYETENQYSKRDGSVTRIMNAAVRGKYVAMCEGDDYWTDPLKLQKQVDFLEKNPSIGLVYTDFDLLKHETGDLKTSAFTNGWMPHYRDDVTFFLEKGYRAPLTWLMRTELATKPLPIKGCVDGTYARMLEIILSPWKIHYLPESTAVYRLHEGSATHCPNLPSYYKRIKGLWNIQKAYIDRFSLTREQKKELFFEAYHHLATPAIMMKDTAMIHEIGEWIHQEGCGHSPMLRRISLINRGGGISAAGMRLYIHARSLAKKILTQLHLIQ